MAAVHIAKMIHLLASNPIFDNGRIVSRSNPIVVLLKKYQSLIGEKYNTENPEDILSKPKQ